VPLTAALQADSPDFGESIDFLLRSNLIRQRRDARGEILYYDDSVRRALDFYRNSILHYLVAPSFLARSLLRGVSAKQLRQDLVAWLELFALEFFVPRAEVLAAHLEGFLDAFERNDLLERQDDRLMPTAMGRPYFHFLATQTQAVLEGYYAAFLAVLASDEWTSRKRLVAAAAEQFERSQVLGEVGRLEGANPVTFGNAVRLPVQHGVLEEHRVEGGPEAVITRGSTFDDLAGLRDRLAAELAPR